MVAVADSKELRDLLNRFVSSYVVEQEQITSAQVLRDDEGDFIAVAVEPKREIELPAKFEGLRVVVNEREPGHVAAGPLR